MSEGQEKKKRGRPPRTEARTLKALDDIVLKVANSTRQVQTPDGAVLKSLFEISVMNTTSEKPSVRLAAKALIDLAQAAGRREENRQSRERSLKREKAPSGWGG